MDSVEMILLGIIGSCLLLLLGLCTYCYVVSRPEPVTISATAQKESK